MRRVMKAIREKNMVGILLDQNVDWYEGVFAKFLGRWACTNKGLAVMALRTGAPVVPAFAVRQKDGRYHIIFEDEIELVRTGDQTKDIEQNTALFTDIIETYIRRYPDHYFWFHRRWKTQPYCPLPDDFYLSHKAQRT
jgi:KDO2-lipid IV(A) lauroyltransferase